MKKKRCACGTIFFPKTIYLSRCRSCIEKTKTMAAKSKKAFDVACVRIDELIDDKERESVKTLPPLNHNEILPSS